MRFIVKVLLSLSLLSASSFVSGVGADVTISSKQFTESVLLGEVAAVMLRGQAIKVLHRGNLGGTRILWQALVRGDIDIYPEYTGTLIQEIFGGKIATDDGFSSLQRALAQQGVRMTAPLGFNNTYALGMLSEKARNLGIFRISDLLNHPDLRFGFSSEFLARADGWKPLRASYGLPQKSVRGLDHEIAYRGLVNGELDVIDLYTTDPEIAYYKLGTLQDDKGHFPNYFAVYLYRADLVERRPTAVSALRQLEGRISQQDIQAMNEEAKFAKQSEVTTASNYVRRAFGIDNQTALESRWVAMGRTTLEHLWLVGTSLAAAIVVGIPLGVVCARWQRGGQLVINAIAVLQTVPALALLVFMLPVAGIGDRPAIVAVFIYSVLPIVSNTCSGLLTIPRSLQESAEAIGLPAVAKLTKIELPLAASTITTGIKTAAVISVGTATLGALVGAGGYGQPILTGIRLADTSLILQGAVPSALLAVVMQLTFSYLEKRLATKF